jgi:LmbE family N-acetylglucosaminyl deacetylase
MLFALFVMLVAIDSGARSRAVSQPGSLPNPRSVLWIAAHPDDEAVVAPLLAKWCLDEEARCGLLVLTRGEAGPCVRESGCEPDIASVRSSEAAAASELFRADSFLLRYPDGGGVVPPVWSLEGDSSQPVTTIAALITAFDPELILTFDPRHGTSCHPDHRETGRLVLDAVQRLPKRPTVHLLETVVTYSERSVRFTSALPEALAFDATQALSSGDEAWSAIVRDMERHPSQFTPELIEMIRNVPRDERRVFIAPAETALARPVTTCR